MPNGSTLSAKNWIDVKQITTYLKKIFWHVLLLLGIQGKELQQFNTNILTDRSSVLPFCPNQTEQVNQSSVSRTETQQNRKCKKRMKT